MQNQGFQQPMNMNIPPGYTIVPAMPQGYMGNGYMPNYQPQPNGYNGNNNNNRNNNRNNGNGNGKGNKGQKANKAPPAEITTTTKDLKALGYTKAQISEVRDKLTKQNKNIPASSSAVLKHFIEKKIEPAGEKKSQTQTDGKAKKNKESKGSSSDSSTGKQQPQKKSKDKDSEAKIKADKKLSEQLGHYYMPDDMTLKQIRARNAKCVESMEFNSADFNSSLKRVQNTGLDPPAETVFRIRYRAAVNEKGEVITITEVNTINFCKGLIENARYNAWQFNADHSDLVKNMVASDLGCYLLKGKQIQNALSAADPDTELRALSGAALASAGISSSESPASLGIRAKRSNAGKLPIPKLMTREKGIELVVKLNAQKQVANEDVIVSVQS